MNFFFCILFLHAAALASQACKVDQDCDYAVSSDSCPVGVVAVAKDQKEQFYREQREQREQRELRDRRKKTPLPCTKVLAKEADDRFSRPACVKEQCTLILKSSEELKQSPSYCDTNSDCGLYRAQSFQPVDAINKRLLPAMLELRLELEKGKKPIAPRDRIEDYKAVCKEHSCAAELK